MLAFPHTHAWSRRQKTIIIAATLVVLSAFVAFAYRYDRSHRLPDETILAGTWEMTEPQDPDNCFLLRMEEERFGHWHNGAWARYDRTDFLAGYSEMGWYAGGPNIYMRFVDDPMPQIWQIVDVRPEQLRLRHAKRDYVFKRFPD